MLVARLLEPEVENSSGEHAMVAQRRKEKLRDWAMASGTSARLGTGNGLTSDFEDSEVLSSRHAPGSV